MKIRIKRKLNESKDNLMSDIAKKVFNKFGGIESALENEDIPTATELTIGMEIGNKEALNQNHKAFEEIVKDFQNKKQALIAKRVKDAEAEAYKMEQDYIDHMLQDTGMSYDELMYGPAGGGPHYYSILDQGKKLIQKAKDEPTEIIDKQIQDLQKASKAFLDASRE